MIPAAMGLVPLQFDWPGATQLRVSVIVFGFLNGVWG